MEVKTAFITGTGFYSLPGMQTLETIKMVTPFGEVLVEICIFRDQTIALIPRHGKEHTIAPDEINYRANIFALKHLGVKRILATSVCGSLQPEWSPGSLVLIDQFINFAYGRKDTFYPMDGKIVHVDVTDPYCKTIHNGLFEAADLLNINLYSGATYACWNGPRFETRAEIEMTRRLGGQLVGQTNYPECVLAREMAICYATIGVVSNFAAGMQDRVTVAEVLQNLEVVGDRISKLYSQYLILYPDSLDCSCQHALDGAVL
ncbi:MAG: MTAP family purine nucleoside phosphorylase [Anaerolineales bacterium]|nr:MTAP family purine nucleoside phosphorylase [Anaerolineales bacterium]